MRRGEESRRAYYIQVRSAGADRGGSYLDVGHERVECVEPPRAESQRRGACAKRTTAQLGRRQVGEVWARRRARQHSRGASSKVAHLKREREKQIRE